MAFIGHSGGASSPALTDIAFSGNSANTFGGAMFKHAEASGTSSPTLTRVTFSGNRSTQFCGAMVSDGTADGTSNPTLVNVTFVGNSASQGGTMYQRGFVRPNPASAGLTNRCDVGAVEAGSFFTELVFKNGFESP